ncbi:outer membrane protein [Primorskyibacter sp. S87]|uniref:outer membrane protein n=1 Tax=Primorskyibacter sp. S87 TaxID=3415126 RepID=UPI003C7B2B26
MKLLTPALVASALLTTPAIAGDWTGAYGGIGIGQTDADGPGALDGDNTSYGVHLGYDYDFGDIVLGGEFEYDRTNISLGNGAAQLDNVARLKLKAGYDFGAVLGYAVLGGANADFSTGNESGYLYGLGLGVPVTDQWSFSGEILRHDFSNVNGAGDAKADTLNLRASFRF